MKSLILAGILAVNTEFEVLSKPNFRITTEAGESFFLKRQDFCKDLGFDYQQDRSALNKAMQEQSFLKEQLLSYYSGLKADLSEREILDKLKFLNEEVKFRIKNLNFAGQPEFTDMKYQVEITWKKESEPLHFDDNYSSLIGNIRSEGRGSIRGLSEDERRLLRNGRPFTRQTYEVNYMYYAGEEFKEIAQSFYIDTGLDMSKLINKKNKHFFRIRKTANKIEICQFLNRLEVGLEIHETIKHEFSDEITTHKQIYLKF